MASQQSLETSYWQKLDKPFFAPLSSNVATDVCVVGAGISGLTTAYQLLKEGRRVVVIDRERLGQNETGHTSAHLSSALDEGFVKLRRLHGDGKARLAAESHRRAIDEIENIIREEKIDCDFQRLDGHLALSITDEREVLEQELEAARALGFDDVELLERFRYGSMDLGPVLRYPRQARFHPIKYLLGLANAVVRRGGRIFMHAAAIDVEGGQPAVVTTSQGFQITADHVVVATNVPINNIVTLHTKAIAHRSYLIGLRVPRGSVPDTLVWDTANPYHYVRLISDPETDHDLVLIGGEDHRTGQNAHVEEHYAHLEEWARGRLGIDAPSAVRWSGQIIEPVDGLAFIGRNPRDSDNIYVITGDSGHGLTHGTLGGMLIRDLILGRDNPWAALYDPSRTLHGVTAYLKENLQTALNYADWLSAGDVESVDDIKPGEGAIIRQGLKKLAVYKSPLGRVHVLSAMCPHLGGIVHWNAAEKTWDCPCHGSRFDGQGDVLNGPAIEGLAPAESPDNSVRDPLQAAPLV
ncbi:MAG: FAD-dependent oxidoreductase [Bdellovibrionaceae bacterium]|nr:FAD-dependent oxidoreductase [Pseudobdellovibrionaceae bacterium]MBX3032862.1 FAD-dependent oxidoreductase [Pseudobdellovibrionaceae bacterium]